MFSPEPYFNDRYGSSQLSCSEFDVSLQSTVQRTHNPMWRVTQLSLLPPVILLNGQVQVLRTFTFLTQSLVFKGTSLLIPLLVSLGPVQISLVSNGTTPVMPLLTSLFTYIYSVVFFPTRLLFRFSRRVGIFEPRAALHSPSPVATTKNSPLLLQNFFSYHCSNQTDNKRGQHNLTDQSCQP
jgi:hypothetical protein